MDLILMQLFNGLSVSSILLLAALGLAITFGLMGIINMAHGEFIMIGAYTAYVVQNVWKSVFPESSSDIYFLLEMIAAFFVTAIVGLILERLIIRHLYGRALDSLLVTWGISLVLQQAVRSIFGPANVSVSAPAFLDKNIQVTGMFAMSGKRLFILALAVVCCTLIALMMYKTKQGRNIRAAMQNRDMAASLGVNTAKCDMITFAVGSGFAGIAGCAITFLGPIGPTIGQSYIVDAFMTVVVGGVGKIIGCITGATIIGVGGPTFEFFTSASLGKVMIFIVVIIILQFKPKGIFSMHSRALDD
ncbi:MAG: urea ABC transporter permease subunit UrtB [Oscillospiraceae bacterium]|nr:urea ABC transporter permease subunit UrtB [Oscillospiraceae bacterium]